jgi:threonine dehydrogenase-like Zn-dependent dehydrogenase
MAKQLGATHIFDSHDPTVADEIIELTGGGAPHVVEAVGNQNSMDHAVGVARPGGTVSFVGVPHHVQNGPIKTIFDKSLTLRGGPAPVREYLPQLIASLQSGHIDPSPVLDLALPLSRVAEGYAAMDERRAIKTLLTVS